MGIALLTLLNSLLEHYLPVDSLPSEVEYLAINYRDNTVTFQDSLPLAFQLNTAKTTKRVPVHSFERFTYSSFCLLAYLVLFDLLWLWLSAPTFISSGCSDGLLLPLPSSYRHYVVYC